MPTEVIRIPSERHAQLKALAKHREQSIAECVGDLIASELDRTSLNETIGLPPFDIACSQDGTIHFGGPVGNFIWTKAEAASVADTLTAFAEPRGKTASMLDMDAGMKFRRVGVSVEMASVENGNAVTIAPAIAKEIARLLRRAVA